MGYIPTHFAQKEIYYDLDDHENQFTNMLKANADISLLLYYFLQKPNVYGQDTFKIPKLLFHEARFG